MADLNGDIDPDVHYSINSDCYYYDRNVFDIEFGHTANSLSFFHLNIRSFHRNIDETLVFLNSLRYEFSVIVLTETWLLSESDYINVDGYVPFHSVRGDRRGGGVTILVREHLDCDVIPALTACNDIFEICSVRVKCSSKSYNILGVYRPPGGSIVDFNTSLTLLITFL